MEITKSNTCDIQNKLGGLCAELIEGTKDRMSWAYFWATVGRLKDTIEADVIFHPDVVLSIGRSGSVVGGLLAGNMGGLIHLGIDRENKWLEQEGRTRRVVEVVPHVRTIADLLVGKNVLCVMSECDSGRTLEAVLDDINTIEGIGMVRTAVLFRNVNTFFRPNYVGEEDRGQRADFPFRTSDWPRTSKGPAELIDR